MKRMIGLLLLCASCVLLLSTVGCTQTYVQMILESESSDLFLIGSDTILVRIPEEDRKDNRASFSESVGADDILLPAELEGKTVSVVRKSGTELEITFSGASKADLGESASAETFVTLRENAFSKKGFHAFIRVTVSANSLVVLSSSRMERSGLITTSFTMELCGAQMRELHYTVENISEGAVIECSDEGNILRVTLTDYTKLDDSEPVAIVFDASSFDVGKPITVPVPESILDWKRIYF